MDIFLFFFFLLEAAVLWGMVYVCRSYSFFGCRTPDGSGIMLLCQGVAVGFIDFALMKGGVYYGIFWFFIGANILFAVNAKKTHHSPAIMEEKWR